MKTAMAKVLAYAAAGLGFALVLLPAALLQGSREQIDARAGSGPLALTAAAARSVVCSGEPVYLVLSLKNVSHSPVQLGMFKYPAANFRLEVEEAGHRAVPSILAGQPTDPAVRRVGPFGSAGTVEIDPMSQVRSAISVSPEFYHLTEPGKYYVRATLAVTGVASADRVVSNWAEVSIVSPNDVRDRPGPPSLELTASPLAKEVRLGAGARFDVTLRNLSGEPWVLDGESFWHYDMDIVGPDGQAPGATAYEGELRQAWLNSFPRGEIELPPTGLRQVSLNVAERYQLKLAGRYVIYFYRRLLDGAGTEYKIRSVRPVELTVVR